jgi:hypothetical protein
MDPAVVQPGKFANWIDPPARDFSNQGVTCRVGLKYRS